MYIWYTKGDTESRVGTQAQFLSSNDPEHSHVRQQQEPLNTNSSKIQFGNTKYTGVQIQSLCLQALFDFSGYDPLYLYRPYKNQKARKSPCGAFDKIPSKSGRIEDFPGICNKKKKSPDEQVCGV